MSFDCKIVRSRGHYRVPHSSQGSGTLGAILIFFAILGGPSCAQHSPERAVPEIVVSVNEVHGHRFIPIPAGDYWIGAEGHFRNPRRQVHIDAFEIADTETTNAQFAEFITATNYITDAERLNRGQTFKEGMADWQWDVTKGANWRHPFGPDDTLEEKMNHPVTQISAADADAYCKWAGYRLPTLEEWEVAARAGKDTRFPWGDELATGGHYRANTWQGKSHAHDTREDGFLYTAPVRSFPPNAWGLYDVIGNVFEYCSNPGINRYGKPDVDLTTGRGGSWWCSAGTCNYYNLVDTGQMARQGSLCNQGFRVVRSIPTQPK